MDFRKLLVIFSVCVALPAMAEIRTLTDSRELRPSEMTVPTSVNSRVAFRSCEECDLETARLTPATAFSVNGNVVEFDDFRQAFIILRQRGNGYALLSIDTKNQTIVSIKVAD